MVRLEGPVVRELDAVFATDWYSETGVLLPLDSRQPESSAQGSALIDAQVCPAAPASTTTTI